MHDARGDMPISRPSFRGQNCILRLNDPSSKMCVLVFKYHIIFISEELA